MNDHEEYSLPFPLHHKALDFTPFTLPTFISKDKDYAPDETRTAQESSEGDSSGSLSTFSRSSYDPL